MTVGEGQVPGASGGQEPSNQSDDTEHGNLDENEGAEGESQRSRLSREELESELRKTRREAAGFRRQLRDLQAGTQKVEAEKGGELNKLSGERDTLRSENSNLKSELQQERGKNKVSSVATQLGFRNPGLAHRLLDLGSYDFSDREVDKDVSADLRKVLRDNPYLAGTSGGGDGGDGRNGQPPGKNDMSSLIRRASGR